ncbi:MAG: adenylyl-sulfate kinase [Anaerolineaceae bacterium]|nr:adenylyl-sulfate kinase [Anaerolineaceae bacterium]
MEEDRQELKLVVAGHVDHGKSTIIGRMLADTGSLPEGKLESVRENCRRNSKPFEYAFLLDVLKDEQAQGITIDAARIFFNTKKRNYLIIDAPGHIEFLKNMITGASWAEAALLVIDAKEGVQENSRRHGYMISFLGIHQICVLVNKMDLVNYDQKTFEKIKKEYTDFLANLDIEIVGFIPVSGLEGDNITVSSEKMSWYKGPTVLDQLDLFEAKKLPKEKPLRMPVQDVYKFTANGDDRRIVVGRIESGRISVGDEVVFYPSGKTSTVRTIESFNIEEPPTTLSAGWCAGFTLEEQVFVKRGEIAFLKNEPKPAAASLLKVRLFWLGKQPLVKNKKYIFKLGSAKVEMQVEEIERVLDASTLKAKKSNEVKRNDIAKCILRLDKVIAFDVDADMPETGRFVIVDNYEISGGGVVAEALPDENSWLYENIAMRNEKWEPIAITEEMRAERFNQKACMILITGSPKDTLRKKLAKNLTETLFRDGKFVYFLGMANLLYGMDADIRAIGEDVRPEHIRRLAEIGNMMMHAGLILVVAAREINQKDVRALKTSFNGREDRLITVWAGDKITTDLKPDIHFKKDDVVGAVKGIKTYLKTNGYLFNFKFDNSIH